MEMFTPWICSIPLPGNKESDQMHSPCLEPESGIMGTAMDYFVDAIDAAHVRLKGDTHTHTHTLSLTLSLSHTHTHTHTHSHSLSLSQTQLDSVV